MNRHVVEEVDGEFVLPLEGFVCTYLQNDDELILCAPDSSDEAWLRASRLKKRVIRRLCKRRVCVTRAVAGRDATLRVDFDDGFSLVNPPDKEFEMWELRGPGYVLLVGTPGGGPPAVWDATSEVRRIRSGDPLPARVAEMIELYEMPEWIDYDFQFRPTNRGREAIELHPPDAPQLNRGQILRFVLPGGSRGPYMRITN